MKTFRRKDHYYLKAKQEGLASRAAFKLSELLAKYPLIKKGYQVLELGAAPGGWTQILSEKIGKNGKVLGIDRLPLKIKTADNIEFWQEEIDFESLPDRVKAQFKNPVFHTIFSDLSPNLSGTYFKDGYASYELCLEVFNLAKKLLNHRGNFVYKIFPSEDEQKLFQEVKKQFERVKTIKLDSTRKSSKEIYVVALGFKGPA